MAHNDEMQDNVTWKNQDINPNELQDNQEESSAEEMDEY